MSGRVVPVTVALDLAGRGWHVHPLCWPDGDGMCARPGRWDRVAQRFVPHEGRDVGKAPLTRSGWHDATADPEEVRAYWRQWPAANVGVALKPSGLVLVDPDSEDARAEVDELGRPPTVVRHSRNVAYLYARPDGCPTELALKRGRSATLDVMSLGYAVVYGTHQTGALVSLTWGDGPAPVPRWAVTILVERQREREAKRAQDQPRSAGQPVDLEDAALLTLMFAASNGATIRKLWHGDWEEDPRWPSRSEADQALCNHLAWWTRRDAARIDRLFRCSGLMREKWGGTYARATIDKAIAWAPYGFGEANPKDPRLAPRRHAPRRAPLFTFDEAELQAARASLATFAPRPWASPSTDIASLDTKTRPTPWRCACGSLESGPRPSDGVTTCDGCAEPVPGYGLGITNDLARRADGRARHERS